MKAKEYAKKIVDAATEHKTLEPEEQIDFLLNAILDVNKGYVFETQQLIESRKAQTNSAVAAVIREQYVKWRSMCRHIKSDLKEDLLDPEGWKVLVRTVWPEVYDFMQKYGWR